MIDLLLVQSFGEQTSLFSLLGEKKNTSFVVIFSFLEGNISNFNNQFLTKAQLPGLTLGRGWRKGGMFQNLADEKACCFVDASQNCLNLCVCARALMKEGGEERSP